MFLIPKRLLIHLIGCFAIVLFSIQVRAATGPLDSLRFDLKQKVKPDAQRVHTLVLIGNLYTGISLDSAQLFASEARAIAEKINHPQSTLEVLLLTGTLEVFRGNLDVAMARFISARKLANGRSGGIWEKNRAMAEMNIGGIFYSQMRYQKAYPYLKNAAEAFERLKADSKAADAYRGLALIFRAEKKTDSARYYLVKAAEIYKTLGEETKLNQTDVQLSGLELELGHWAEAYAANKKLLTQLRAPEDKGRVAVVQSWLATAALRLGKKEEAYRYFHAALPVLREINSWAALDDTYLGLSQYFEQQLLFDSAFHYFKAYNTVDSLLFVQSKNERTAQLESEYSGKLKESQRSRLMLENKRARAKNFLYLVLLGSSVLVILVVSVFFKTLQKRKEEIETKHVELNILNADVELALQKMTQLSKEKQHLVSLLSHDLRAPLEIIQLNALLLETGTAVPSLQAIQQNARLIHAFSLRIMAAEYIEDRDIPLQLQGVNIQKLAERLMQRFESQLQQQTVEILWEPKNNESTVLADPFFLEECLAGLYGYMLKGAFGGAIVCAAYREGDKVRMVLTDNTVHPTSSVEEGSSDKKKDRDTRPGLEEQDLFFVQRYVQVMGGQLQIVRQDNHPIRFEILVKALDPTAV